MQIFQAQMEDESQQIKPLIARNYSSRATTGMIAPVANEREIYAPCFPARIIRNDHILAQHICYA
ncbi:hypothetical protein T05_13124, partial [Trichinella murrelli]